MPRYGGRLWRELRDYKRRLVLKELETHGFVVTKAARALEVTPQSLYVIIEDLEIEIPKPPMGRPPRGSARCLTDGNRVR